jgi:5-methylcytosine-specific restriction endonuclease McrA
MAIPIISRADAQANGLTRYFTGQPCKHGHIAERQVTNGVCLVCRYEIEKRWRVTNPDSFRAKLRRQAARYRSENPERIRRNRKKWELNNPDKVKERIDRWRKANPERVRQKEKRWRDKNPEKISKKNRDYKTANAERLKPLNIARVMEWRKENPEKVRAATHKRRARKKNASGSHTGEQLIDLLKRQGHKCAGCFTSIKTKRHLDHVIPLARGGSNDISNLQWLCQPCNNSKHAKDPLVWAHEHGRLL